MKILVYKSELEEVLKQLEFNYNSGVSNSKKIINNILAANEPEDIPVKDEVSELFLDYILTHSKPMYYSSTNHYEEQCKRVWRFPDDRDLYERAKKLKNILGK